MSCGCLVTNLPGRTSGLTLSVGRNVSELCGTIDDGDVAFVVVVDRYIMLAGGGATLAYVVTSTGCVGWAWQGDLVPPT